LPLSAGGSIAGSESGVTNRSQQAMLLIFQQRLYPGRAQTRFCGCVKLGVPGFGRD